MPKSAVRNWRKGAIPSRLVMTGAFLLFLSLIVVISSGIAIGLGYTPRPPSIGWILFIGGIVVAVSTVGRWVVVLPGIFGIGTLNGMIILASGHALNQPAVPVSRLAGAILTIVMAGSCVMTATLAVRKMTTTDRAAYVGILLCFVAMLTCLLVPIDHWEIPLSFGFVACMALLLGRRLLFG